MGKQKSLGVVIGRFQLHELHEGHVFLLDTVSERHEQMLILVGCTRIRFHTDDPFPFPVRKQMLESRYPRATILPIFDSPVSNEYWSAEVDKKVAAVAETSQAVLYGGRDSFIPKYCGRFQTHELNEVPDVSATAVRATAGQEIVDNPTWRQGWLAAINHQYAVTDPTVDLAIVSPDYTRVLMGRRHETSAHIRFIGGFVDPEDESNEAAVNREGFEEVVGVELSEPHYVGSSRIRDPRYRTSKYGVMTTFFVRFAASETGSGGDDMPHVEWWDLDEGLYEQIAPEHVPLVQLLLAYKAKHMSTNAQ